MMTQEKRRVNNSLFVPVLMSDKNLSMLMDSIDIVCRRSVSRIGNARNEPKKANRQLIWKQVLLELLSLSEEIKETGIQLSHEKG